MHLKGCLMTFARQLRSTLTIAALCASASSCGGDPISCDVCSTDAVAFGRITDQSGSPIANAPISVHSFTEDCVDLDVRGSGSGPTNAAGDYRLQIRSIFKPHTARCFRIIVNPEGIAGFPTGMADVPGDVEFRPGPEAAGLDSVRLDASIELSGPVQ